MRTPLSRRTFLALASTLGSQQALAVLRVPAGSALRLPLPAARRVHDPARAVDWADAWALALTHETIASTFPDATTTWPLLVGAPAIDRSDARLATLTLRPSMTFSNGAAVNARAVVESWRAARGSALGRLALSRLDTMNPFEARSDSEISVRLAVGGTLDETLAAWPLCVAAPTTRAGLGAFMARDANTLVRNPTCPLGPAFLDAVVFEPPRSRNDELRAFTTGSLDASWWGNSLYTVTRPSVAIRGEASVVVGMVPSRESPIANPSAARSLETVLAPLCNGEGALLGNFGFTPESSATSRPDVSALTRSLQQHTLRISREAGDGILNAVAERAMALLDAAGIRVVLTNPGEPCDATLRGVAPLRGDTAVALASFVAAAAAAGGDEAGASAIVRTPAAQRTTIAAGVWGRGTMAVLGRATPVLHVRQGVHDIALDGAGRVVLCDAWIAR
jgi:hypothetical protein